MSAAEDLWSSIQDAASQPVTLIVLGFLLYIAILSGIRIATAKRRATAVKGLLSSRSLRDLRDRLGESRDFEHLAKAVTRFAESLVQLEDEPRPIRGESASIFIRTEDLIADLQPTGHTLSKPSISFDSLDHVPGWCTGLGILGTFVGVSIGLGMMSTDSGNLDTTIMPIVASLASAFWTSILGVLFAMIIGYYTRRAQDVVERTVLALTTHLDGLTMPRSESDKAHEHLSRGAVSSVIEDPSTLIAKVLGDPAVAKLTGLLLGKFDEMINSVSVQVHKSRELAEEHVKEFTRQATTHIGRAVREELGKFSDVFNDLAQTATKLDGRFSELLETVNEQQKAITTSVGLVTSSLANLEALSKGLAQLTTRNEESVTRLGGVIKDFQARYDDLTVGAEHLAGALREVPTVVERLIANQENLSAQFRRVQEQLTGYPVALIDGFRKLHEASIGHFESLQEELSTHLREIQSEATQSLRGLSGELAHGRDTMMTMLEQFRTAVAPTLNNVALATRELQQVAGQLNQVAASTSSTATSQAAAVQSIQQSVATLSGLLQQALAPLNNALQGLTPQMSSLANAMGSSSQQALALSNSLVGTNTQLTNLPGSIAQSVQRGMAEQLQAVSASAESMRNEVAALRASLENTLRQIRAQS